MIMFKDFAGNARKKKKKQAGTQKKVNKVKQLGIHEGRQVFEYIGKVIKPAVDARDDTLTRALRDRIVQARKTSKGRGSDLNQRLVQAHREMEDSRKETARLRREEPAKEEGEPLRT